MQDITTVFESFSTQDLNGVVALLQTCLPIEPITLETFTRRVLLDPNFDRAGATVARNERGKVIGFALAMALARLPDGKWASDRGWITLFAVAPGSRRQGVGSRLFQAAEAFLADRGCKAVGISPYGPGYWIPGIDEAAYPEAISWVERQGYHTVTRPLSMEITLGSEWKMPEKMAAVSERLSEKGILLAAFSPAHALPILEFLRQEFSDDWESAARETMRDILAGYRPKEAIWTAMRGEKCIGFAQFSGERFGPIGVSGSERGMGIGKALMFLVLKAMNEAGRSRAYFMWTADATADNLYRPAGFREVRRFRIFKKALAPQPERARPETGAS